VAQAEKRVANQREVLERLIRDGDSERTVNAAKAVLQAFEETLGTMRQHVQMEGKEQGKR